MPAALHARRALALAAAAPMAATLFVVSTGSPVQAAETTRHERLLRVANTAADQIGDAYEYGADGPHRFDCSGLTSFSYGQHGFNLPRTSDAQADYTRRISRSEMKQGDLMFFHDNGDVYHVGVFVGWDNGQRQMVHASNPDDPVKRDPAWTDSWFAGTLRNAG